jgi:hypothetical protein
MIKNVMSIKPLTSLFLAATVVGAFSYSHSIQSPLNDQNTALLAIEALTRASSNFNYLVQTNSSETSIANDTAEINVNDRIVNVIEVEIKDKINTEKRKITSIAKTEKKSFYDKTPVIKKDWNDIKPTLTNIEWATKKKVFVKSLEIKNENKEFVAINNKVEIETTKFNENVQVKPKLFADEVTVLNSSVELNLKPNQDISLSELEREELAEFKAEIAASELVLPNKELVAESSLETDELLSPSIDIDDKMALVSEVNYKKDEDEFFEKQLAAVVETDEVSTQMAAAISLPESPKEEKIAIDNPTKDNGDDLVMFDYSKLENKELTSTKKIFDEPLSSTVKEVIEREVKGTEAKANVFINPSRKAIPKSLKNEIPVNFEVEGEDSKVEQEKVVFDYPKKEVAKNDYSSALAAFAAPLSDVSSQVSLKINAFEINMNTQKVRPSVGYEFVPDYERAERTDDQAGGEIELSGSLSSDQGTISGVVQAQGYIPTRIEANLLDRKIEIPLFDEVGMQKFLEKKKILIVGNLILIGLSDEIVDVDLDTQFQEKLYFNQKYQMLKDSTGAEYVMLAGVTPGNHMLKYSLKNKETASKIIYVGDGEIYFDNPEFESKGRDIYTFTTRSLLGKKIKELNINVEDVKMFGSSSATKKKSINSYELKLPIVVNNNRKYIEFKHLGYPLYVGTGKNKELEIPGNDFITKVMSTFDLNQLGERCLLQINLSKDVRNIVVNGKNKSGEMFVESIYLDNEGVFSSDSAELAEKVFVTGDQEGIMAARIDYADGSTDFLKSYCSQGSYLVEQL